MQLTVILVLFLWGYVWGAVPRASRSVSSDQFEAMTSHLELLEMDYADQCTNLSKARRKVLMGERESYENEVIFCISHYLIYIML